MPPPLSFPVGIPTFNQADFLEETIQSLLRQTRPPDEIVISDHYSTDHTPEIIQKYVADTSHGVLIRGLQPPRDVNLTGQYDFTLKSQNGDWITLLSSDDVARPNFVQCFLDGASSHPGAVLVRAGWENIDTQGTPVSQNFMLSVPKVENPPDTLISQRHGPQASFAAFAIERRAFLQSGPACASVESLADWALFLQIAPFGSFVYRNEIVSGYRVGHDGNKFRNRIGMWLRDEERMFYTIMPRAAEQLHMTDLGWLDEASQTNFRRYLAAASKEFSPDERATVAPLFEAWATRLELQPLVQAFARGENVREPFALLKSAKSLLRPLAQKVYAQTRARTR